MIDDPNDLDDIERMIKFNELAEEYGRQIAAFETAPWVSEFELLRRDGVTVLPPQELDDDALGALLWRIIESLAKRNTFFYQTDHLSDRAFYTQLWEEVLHEPSKDYSAVLDEDEITSLDAWVHCIDMCQADGECLDYWRYYADDQTREEDARHYPDIQMPPREPLPYDRDRFLPRDAEQKLRAQGKLDEWDGPDDDDPPA